MKIAIFARESGIMCKERVFDIIIELKKRGAELSFYTPFYEELLKLKPSFFAEESLFKEYEELSSQTDVMLCLGGDGTLLESLTYVQDKGIPIAGINFGRLGFLTSADAETGDEWIDKLFKGEYSIEKRSVLSVSSNLLPKDFCKYALNEISFQRRDSFMLTVYVKINDRVLPPYWSDGLVLSTPTGSTAYSLSVGGPITIPGVRALILAPIAPHNLNVRPLVIPDDSTLEIYIESRRKEALMSLDNRSLVLPQNQKVVITKAGFFLNYISFCSDGFIGALKEKLMWGEDKRNY